MVGKKACSRCGTPFPADNEHFSYTSSRGYRYLRGICKGCQALDSAVHYQKNKQKIKKAHVEYNRRYRAECPDGYNFKNRKYRQRKALEGLE